MAAPPLAEGAWPITMGTYVALPKVAADTARTARALRFFVWAYGRGDALAEQIELGVVVDHHRPRGERRALGATPALDSDPAAGKFNVSEMGEVRQV